MRRILFLALVCLTALPALAQDNYIIDSTLVKARDGALISVLMVRDKNITTPQPVVLQFTIYARQNEANKLKDVVQRGYIGVVAYTRGKRNSPTEPIPYEFDGRDCYDVIDWISKQSWCNGKIGMYGGSYNGFAQWAATKRLHPALKTIAPSVSVAPGLDVPMTNNVVMSFVFPWTYYVTNTKFIDDADYNNTNWDSIYRAWYAKGSAYKLLDSVAGRGYNKIFRKWLEHPSYDAYWQNMIPYKNEFSHIDIPVLSTTGYYDGGQIGAMYYFREHHRYNPKAEHYLLIGPYGHFGAQSKPDSVYNGYTIDAVANISIRNVIFQWFNYILKDSAKPAILKDTINFEVMGANEWRHAPSLSRMSNDSLEFYLADHKLVTAPKSGFTLQKVDFADRNTTNGYYRAFNIIYDSLLNENGLIYTSAPVEQDMLINGAFSGQLQLSINKKDIDFSVTLYELMPDGKYFYLSYFMGRASYARNVSKRQLLHPGKIETIPFTNTYITSKKISKGSRIVIEVNINKSPYEQINYGTGKDVNEENIKDAKTPLLVKWYNSSKVFIPVLTLLPK